MADTTDKTTLPRLPRISSRLKATKPALGVEAQELIRRAPAGFLWNQIGSLWLFVAALLFQVAITRGTNQLIYGEFAIILTIYNTANYIAAFGMEDAVTVFVPRTLGEFGRPAAASMIRRALLTRLVAIGIVSVALYVGLNLLAMSAQHETTRGLADSLYIPQIVAYSLPLAFYVAGTGMMNLLNALFTAVLRTRLTFAVGGLAQLATIAGSIYLLHAGHGLLDVMWLMAGVMWLAAVVYLVLLAPLWLTPLGKTKQPQFGPVLRLGSNAWITNLISGALLKQSAVWVLGFFAVSITFTGYFNLAYQLTHAASALLIAGLGGVGMAAMAASYSNEDKQTLGTAWRAVSKVQVLLAVPLLAYCVIHATTIAIALYGVKYADVGQLMSIFLVFNLFQRLAGGGAHQAALYVLGRQRLALMTQGVGLVVTVVLAIILVPRGIAANGPLGGPAGALIAVGTAQVGVEFVQMVIAGKLLERRYPIRFCLRVALALIPSLVIALVWKNPAGILHTPTSLGPVPIGRFIELGVSVTIFALVLVVSLAFAKPIEYEDVELLAKTNRRLRPILLPFASGVK